MQRKQIETSQKALTVGHRRCFDLSRFRLSDESIENCQSMRTAKRGAVVNLGHIGLHVLVDCSMHHVVICQSTHHRSLWVDWLGGDKESI